jgi:hypothetical protein
VLPVVVILLVFLVGMVAFAIDTGYVALTRTRLQRSADAGVQAGAEKLATLDGEPVPDAAVRAELRKFVTLNESVTVRDEDIKLLRYNAVKPAGQRVSATYSASQRPNGVEVILRRDGVANGRLPLFFGPVLGKADADVRAKSVAYIAPARGVLPNAPLIPYTMHVNYYYAALGQNLKGVDNKKIETTDLYTVRSNLTVGSGSDGIREVVLFGSDKHTPGNAGSIDIGTASNGTPELRRQILYGPTWADFNHPDFKSKLQNDGSLAPPFMTGGDPGLSTGVKDEFEAIVGKQRIVPLFDQVTGSGNNTKYNIVAFAAVSIVHVDLQGNPKRIWVQPTRIFTTKVTPADLDAAIPTEGVFSPPGLVIP